MRISFLLPIALCALSPLAASAQAALSPQNLELLPPSATSEACPVEVNAQHAPGGSTINARRFPSSGASQSLSLSLLNRSGEAIQSMDFEVTGTAPRGRLQPLHGEARPAGATGPGKIARGPGEVVRRVRVARRISESGALDWTISMPHLSAVTRIALVSVTFTNGTSRELGHVSACATAPDSLMLIASER